MLSAALYYVVDRSHCRHHVTSPNIIVRHVMSANKNVGRDNGHRLMNKCRSRYFSSDTLLMIRVVAPLVSPDTDAFALRYDAAFAALLTLRFAAAR